MAEQASRTRPDILRAIWAAKASRAIDDATFRQIVEQETNGRTASTKRLGIGEAHRVLDRLNGKDPAVEQRRRVGWGNQGTRKASRKLRSPSGASNISRLATDKQIDLIKRLAFRCGLTRFEGNSDFVLDRVHLENWMRHKFGKAWKLVGSGDSERFVCSDGLARKVIPALIKWIERRRDMWTAAHGPEVAQVVVDTGYPNREDRDLPFRELPYVITARLEVKA